MLNRGSGVESHKSSIDAEKRVSESGDWAGNGEVRPGARHSCTRSLLLGSLFGPPSVLRLALPSGWAMDSTICCENNISGRLTDLVPRSAIPAAGRDGWTVDLEEA